MSKRLFTVELSYSKLLDEAKKGGLLGAEPTPSSLSDYTHTCNTCVCVCVCCLGKIGEKS